ncbi:MAG: PH domain-containing protein [Pontixanthobacter sp.]
MSEAVAPSPDPMPVEEAEAVRRTHPLSPVVGGLSGIQNAVVPAIAAFVAMREEPWAIIAALAVAAFIFVLSAGGSYLGWKRLTYVVGDTDIRVESGILSRSARSIPFERIQDVSLEQSLLPRLFGLSRVKFETGAGGGDDLSLHYLTQAEGARLRDVVRARKTGAARVGGDRESNPAGIASAEADAPFETSETLFAMDERRVLTFGLFEFSLAIFAAVAAVVQYSESFASFQLYDSDLWTRWAEGAGGAISGLGLWIQVVSVLTGLIAFLLVGSLMGLVRTALRDWDFRLELTRAGGTRNFRRRRGMLTKTDVVMPVHRVQAVAVVTGILRRRFGWHGLKFVSLAQDSGSASHDVAPFAKMHELEPIARIAGFAIAPDTDTAWQRGSRNYRIDSAIIEFAGFAFVAVIVAAVLAIADVASPWFALVPLAVAAISSARQMFLWRYDYNAVDNARIYTRRGWLAPRRDIASRVKLQSVEIARGPLAQRRGYATLKLGLAGGTLDFEGLPAERARELRAAILTSISATDYSALNEPGGTA